MDEPPPPYPVDVDRGRAVLQAYGAYAPGHTVAFEAQRILSDLCAVLKNDQPALDRDGIWSLAKGAADERG